MSDFEYSKELRLSIADELAKKRLPLVNARCKRVKPRKTVYTLYVKRLIDLLLSGTALIVTSPFNLVFAVITFFDVGSPILFRQNRVGKDGNLFELVKFRNMTNETGENGELLPPEKRITKFGRFMRKTSLDELLNFWSIFKGDMSIIGPRPLLPEYTERYSERHKQRLVVRPGLECPMWKKLDHIATWDDQFENDVWYVENLSFVVDCKMIIKLLAFALDGRNSTARADVGRGIFTGYSSEGKAISLGEVEPEFFEGVKL